MRILNGNTSTEIYFNAQDNFGTSLTGASGFSVYRSRNGGSATAMTTPTITEIDNNNMPGVYSLLVDEDTTIGTGYSSQQMVLYISLSGMVPVSKTVEIADSVQVDSNGYVSANVVQISNDTISADNLELAFQSTLAEPVGVPDSVDPIWEKIGYLFASVMNQITVSSGSNAVKTFYDNTGGSLYTKGIYDNGTIYTESGVA